MNAIKFFVTLAVLAACIFAVSAEQDNGRNKRFPYFGGLGYSTYGAYPYAAGYGLGYGLGYGSYGAYGAYGAYGSYGYGAHPYSSSLIHY